MLNLFENEINRIHIINKMSDKQTKFMKNLQLEIDGAPNHFLNTLGDKDVSDFACNSKSYPCPEDKRSIDYPTLKGTYRVPDLFLKGSRHRLCLKAAIRAWYDDYNPDISYDKGDFTRAVWYRYKQGYKHLQMNIKNYEEEEVAKFLQRFRKRFRTMKCDKFKKWLNHV
jgi:hypothetical protein